MTGVRPAYYACRRRKVDRSISVPSRHKCNIASIARDEIPTLKREGVLRLMRSVSAPIICPGRLQGRWDLFGAPDDRVHADGTA